MKSTLSLSQIGLVLITVPLIFGLSFVIFLALILNKSAHEFDRIQNSRLALSQVRDNQMLVSQLFLSIVASLNKPAQDAIDVIDFNLENIRKNRELMRQKQSEQPQLLGLIDKSKQLVDKTEAAALRSKKVFRDESISKPRRFVFLREELFDLFLGMGRLGKSIFDSEQVIQLEAPEQAVILQRRITVAVTTGIVSSLILSLALAIFFSRNILHRLRTIESNAALLGKPTNLHKPLENSDELSRLDRIIFDSAKVLEESRRRERAILDNAVEVLCSLDRSLKILSVGASASRIWQRSIDELKGKTISELLTETTAAHFREYCEKLVAENSTTPSEFEAKVQIPHAAPRDMYWILRWSAENEAFYCIARDITERKTIEAMKQRLIAIVSHDLRTPLSSVSNTVLLMLAGKRGELSETARTELQSSEANLARLMDLVRDLLELERLESGAITMERDCISAVDVCSLAREAVQDLAREHNVEVEPPFGDAAMLGDERRIVQVLTNLLINALNTAPPNSRVNFEIVERQEFIQIKVVDQGTAISAEELPNLFERFATDQANAVDSKQRAAFGLAIVKSIIESHRGSVGVDNNEKGGKSVWIQIPRYDGIDAAEERSQ